MPAAQIGLDLHGRTQAKATLTGQFKR